MEVLKFIFPFHLLLLLNGDVDGKPTVEIVEYFGSLSVKIGKHQEIKCTVENPVSEGVFTWKIGDKEFANVNNFKEIDEDIIEYSLSFTTTKEHDGKEVSCNYKVGGESFKDGVTINAYNLETGPVTLDTVTAGDPVTLAVSANIYPAPATDHITWNIRDSSGNIVNTLNPGQVQGQYNARQLKELGEDMYSISLDIGRLDAVEMAKQHEVVIKVVTGQVGAITKTVDFNLAMKTEEETPLPLQPEEKAKPEEPTTFASSSFVVVIVIIIVIVIMICIGCFCYRKRQKSSKTEIKSSKNDYLPVSTNSTNPAEKIDQV